MGRKNSLTYHHCSSSLVDEPTVQSMEKIRYKAFPYLNTDEDVIPFRTQLERYQFANYATDSEGEVRGILLYAYHMREHEGRLFLWPHVGEAVVDPDYRGSAVLGRLSAPVFISARINHPFLPIYGMEGVFPGSYINLRNGGPVYAWGQEDTPEWEAGALDKFVEEAYEHPPISVVDRETHTARVCVSTGSTTPPKFRSEEHRRAFEDYERMAPDWQQGQVPVVMYEVTYSWVWGFALWYYMDKVKGWFGR